MKKDILKLTIYPNKILRKKVGLVDKITEKEVEILEKMLSVMHVNKGIGLAANQVGIDKQLFVVDLQDGRGPLFFINPKITKKEGIAKMEEGCLSLPGAAVNVKRAEKVTIEALNIEGNSVKIEAEGLLARVLQHELEHLHGKLIIDYLKFPAKLKIISGLKKRNKK